MNFLFRVASILALAISITTVPWLDVIKPVTAFPADCEGGANGFRDIPDDLMGQLVGAEWAIHLGADVDISLRHGTVAGAQRGWALISGATIPGDQVRMDWTQDGGKTWIQCGPFTVKADNHTYTSAAQSTNSSSLWQFRACGALDGDTVSSCTPWW